MQVAARARVTDGSGRKRATAMLFSRTEVFPQPIPLPRAKDICKAMEIPGYFQTMARIDEASVLAFYEEGTMSGAE